MNDERREDERMPVRLLVHHQAVSGESFDIDYATDFSRGGLFIETRRPLAPNATVHVQFAPYRDARVISAFCRVTHVRENGVGAEFISLDAEAQALIDSALKAR